MHTKEDWIRLICESPADDHLRLVFADWLDEQGEGERAEFIRLQIAIEEEERKWSLPSGSLNARHDLQVRCNRLLTENNYRNWIPLFGVDVGGSDGRIHGEFRKGFVYRIELPCQAFMDHCETLFREQPIEEVRLTNKRPTYSNTLPAENWLLQWYDRYNAIGGEPDYGLPLSIMLILIELEGWQRVEYQEGSGRNDTLCRTSSMTPNTHTINLHYTCDPVENGLLSQASVEYGRHKVGLSSLMGEPLRPNV